MRKWKVTIKRVSNTKPTTTEVEAEDLEEIRKRFNLDKPDTEYYNIEEVK